MALIKCPECKKEISDYADKCPNCGYPIKTATSDRQRPAVQTIELTGKDIKKQTLIAVLFLIASFFIVLIGANTAPPLVAIGVLCAIFAIGWLAVLRFKKWWHHQ